MNKKIRKYQQKCFKEYLDDLEIDQPYTFPEGNRIRPLPPVQTTTNGIMIIGAYPSARFEKRKNSINRYRVIPVGNNLHPFAKELYFDGIDVRVLESGDRIREYIFAPLKISPEDCWVTDLVKVFLYKKEHKESVNDIFPSFQVNVLRNKFKELGNKSLKWIQEEILLCDPSIIITLGEEVAKVIENSNKKASELLTNQVRYPEKLLGRPTFYLPHPDACRRFTKWKKCLDSQLSSIKLFQSKNF